MAIVWSPSETSSWHTGLRATRWANRDYRVVLNGDGPGGARTGFPRADYYEPVTPPGETSPSGGLNRAQAEAMAEAIEILKSEGAVIVDPADIPSVTDSDPKSNLMRT